MVATTSTTSSTASIVKSLGSGSGLDTAAIVQGLVDASFAVKNERLSAKAETLTAQISGLAQLKSGITSFDAALKTLVQGGSLATQPSSSNTAVLAASATGSAKLAGLAAQVTVTRLAAAQAATTNTAVSRTAAFNEGALTITIGGVATAIPIGSGDATLPGIAAKINAAGLGLTATVVNDGAGARLTIKGETGAAKAFTLDGVDTDPAATGLSLATLSVGTSATGTTIGVAAADAQVTLDGATFTRASNTIADLVPGVRLELKSLGTSNLGATAPAANISQAVTDFVTAFNELHGQITGLVDVTQKPPSALHDVEDQSEHVHPEVGTIRLQEYLGEPGPRLHLMGERGETRLDRPDLGPILGEVVGILSIGRRTPTDLGRGAGGPDPVGVVRARVAADLVEEPPDHLAEQRPRRGVRGHDPAVGAGPQPGHGAALQGVHDISPPSSGERPGDAAAGAAARARPPRRRRSASITPIQRAPRKPRSVSAKARSTPGSAPSSTSRTRSASRMPFASRSRRRRAGKPSQARSRIIPSK